MILRKLRHKIFHRILLISSLTIIATVIFLIVLISNYYSDTIVQREIDLNTRTLERVEDYFISKKNDWNGFIRDIYGKEELIEDMTIALNHTYEEYLQYRLKKYSEQTSFTPNNMFSYFNAFFTQDDDVNAVVLNSSEYTDVYYSFIYSYGKWNQSIEGLSNDEIHGRIQPEKLQDTFAQTLLVNNAATLQKMGDLTIYYSTDAIKNIVHNEDAVVKSSFFLIDKNEHIIYEDNQGIPHEFIDVMLEKRNGNELKWNGETYIIHSLSDIGDYTAYTVMPHKELNKLIFVRGTMWILIILTVVVSLSITYTFIRNYSARIEVIDQSIQEVQKGDLSIRIPTFKREDELTTIASSFNEMLDELNEYIERVYVLGLKQQQAELKALQSQINPHFLFNTLETIRMTAVIDGSKTSSKMIYHLSRLLRYSLQSKESVPLYLEIENVQQYLQLVQLQHPNKLTIHVNIAKEIERNSIQRLVLQPIVENYIVHGFKKDCHDNRLSIEAEKHDQFVWITVQDNGNGIEKDRLDQIKEHLDDEENDVIDSIGMKNVHQRLKLKYGDEYGLQVESEEGKGTTITLIIPLGGDEIV